MKQRLRAQVTDFLTREDDGATMVEYGLMLGLIALVCIAAITAIGLDLSSFFTAADSSVKAASS